MLSVGITGNVGAGNTYVSKLIELMGFPVFYADEEAKKINQQNPIVRNMLMDITKGLAFYQDGFMNKKVVSECLIANTFEADRVLQVIHRLTIDAYRHWLEEIRELQLPYCFKEAAIMFEVNSATELDLVIGIDAPLFVRRERFLARPNTTLQLFERIEAKQMDATAKMKLCNIVIYNDGSQALIPQIQNFFFM